MGILIGLALVTASGAAAGSVFTPVKFMRKYHFENFWLIHSLIATVLLPWTLALTCVPHLFTAYGRVATSSLILPPLFAFCWGIASTLSGLCVNRIGLSLTYALVIGMGASTGSLVPILYFSPRILTTGAGLTVVLGVVVMLGGIAIVACAGRRKETSEKQENDRAAAGGNPPDHMQGSFVFGLGMALIAGVLSAGLNFSFAFGQSLKAAALALGASEGNATYALWALAMSGGMIPNLGYAIIRCRRNHSWGRFALSPHTDLPLSVLMGVLFMSSTAVYGWGALRLGMLGTSVGWGIMQIMQIVVGNLTGFLLGEWKAAGRGPSRVMLCGLAVLVLASLLMAYGNYLQTPPLK